MSCLVLENGSGMSSMMNPSSVNPYQVLNQMRGGIHSNLTHIKGNRLTLLLKSYQSVFPKPQKRLFEVLQTAFKG